MTARIVTLTSGVSPNWIHGDSGPHGDPQRGDTETTETRFLHGATEARRRQSCGGRCARGWGRTLRARQDESRLRKQARIQIPAALVFVSGSHPCAGQRPAPPLARERYSRGLLRPTSVSPWLRRDHVSVPWPSTTAIELRRASERCPMLPRACRRSPRQHSRTGGSGRADRRAAWRR